MTPAKTARGRPKGSGIDDQPRLLEIARLLCANPRMKPTTAIRSIGVTDPSAIRRLRDKFHSTQAELMQNPRVEPVERLPAARVAAAVTPVLTPAPAPTLASVPSPGTVSPVTAAPVAANDTVPAPRSVPLKIVEPVKHAEPFAPIELGHGLSGLLPAKSGRTDALPIAALFLGFGLNAATALFEQQMMIAQSMMKLPPVRDLVRSQIAITEFMLSVARPSPGSRLAH
jgi:hypothetical protein